jgi:DNA-binding CsgD family transcriptional regulator
MRPLSPSSKRNVKRPKHSWISSAPGLILIDSSFTPIACNQEGAAILTYPHKPNAQRIDTLSVPQEILDEIRRHRLVRSLSVVIPFPAGRREYICHAFPVNFCTWSTQPIFALVLQRNSSADETVYRMAAQFNLTEREREALQGVSVGLSSKELAERMQISPNTVKAYLHLVMVKMGVSSRAGIVAKILEHNSGVGAELTATDSAQNGADTEMSASLHPADAVAPKSRARGNGL